MTCPQCRAVLKQGTAPFHVDRKGYHLLFDTVPAWVCSQCGEVLFEEGEVEAIQGAIECLDRSTEKMAASG